MRDLHGALVERAARRSGRDGHKGNNMQSERLNNIALEAGLLAGSIAAERLAGVEHFNSIAAVSDAFSTPFFRAVKREGFVPVTNKGSHCVETKTCPQRCGHSAVLHRHGEEQVWLCPACDRH
ncbi:hypothetical protein [Duganella vulcania]|uniref:Transcriptional regulator n=1 Tax=Duganella vulcania TaxID=2692166 RepID=A0A845GEZ9_9BURK|nr:hypothetical protein [Duganella vulcania]MYM92491.1 hypothetical protein [Duganella vulcania]